MIDQKTSQRLHDEFVASGKTHMTVYIYPKKTLVAILSIGVICLSAYGTGQFDEHSPLITAMQEIINNE